MCFFSTGQTVPDLSTPNNSSVLENETQDKEKEKETLPQSFDISYTPGPYKIYCQSIDPKDKINAIKIAKLLIPKFANF